jgi:hypothetical protein
MRSSVAWLLLITLALCVVVLWLPERATLLVRAVETQRQAPARGTDSADFTAAAARLPVPLPSVLEPVVLEVVHRDPFAEPSRSVASAPSAARVSVASAPTSATPMPAPLAPPMTWRLLGTMDAPGGERLVMLVQHNEDQTVLAIPGTRLEGGFEVAAVHADGVRLVHPPSNTEVVIPIPLPPSPGR